GHAGPAGTSTGKSAQLRPLAATPVAAVCGKGSSFRLRADVL
ncbi:MAG: hypothetical protein AVDCRST_MAG33-1375, partial [uncultured Thermomicrobiales bacterium]